MKKITGLIGRGFLIWLVPLVVSFFFYTPESELVVSYPLFKSVMVVVLTLVTLAVNWIRPPVGFSPLTMAVIYTAMSLVLDLLILVPMMRLSLLAYLEQIALVYIIIPAITWATQAARTVTWQPHMSPQ
jgi:hypothetical protein